MKDLIEALTIFLKYTGDVYSPTHCVHDLLLVAPGLSEDEVSPEDRQRLDQLGFSWRDHEDCWGSYRFGSA